MKKVKVNVAAPTPVVLEQQIVSTITGLLRIARLAMPATRYESDTRVRRAQKLLVSLGKKPVLW